MPRRIGVVFDQNLLEDNAKLQIYRRFPKGSLRRSKQSQNQQETNEITASVETAEKTFKERLGLLGGLAGLL